MKLLGEALEAGISRPFFVLKGWGRYIKKLDENE